MASYLAVVQRRDVRCLDDSKERKIPANVLQKRNVQFCELAFIPNIHKQKLKNWMKYFERIAVSLASFENINFAAQPACLYAY
jgi:hypothetical protein